MNYIFKDDPRPIELDWRTRSGKEVFVLEDNGEVTVCVLRTQMKFLIRA